MSPPAARARTPGKAWLNWGSRNKKYGYELVCKERLRCLFQETQLQKGKRRSLPARVNKSYGGHA